MKKLENIISISILIFISGIASIGFYESHYSSKFTQTKVPISFQSFKENWGEPDRIMQYGGQNKTVFYYTLLNKFVFKVNEKEIVEYKYEDNF